jgi:hypothetical protein
MDIKRRRHKIDDAAAELMIEETAATVARHRQEIAR